jgi:arylsulfatase A-like enzyme
MGRSEICVVTEARTDILEVVMTVMLRLKSGGAMLGSALVAVMLASVAACSRPAADNLLFVSFDTTRADHISAYGYGQATTPNIDALAQRGVLFERAFSHVPSTLPAHTTMFTGLLPPRHGVRCNGWFRVPLEHETLAETLKRARFATGAVIGAFPLDNRFGLDQGFGTYDARFTSTADSSGREEGRMDAPGEWLTHDYLDFERSAREVTDESIAWLRKRSGSRWFLFAHYFDPHWPYEPTPDWADRFEVPYDAELAFADHHLGRLLAFVEELPGKTLVVFTADHGEGLGEHDEAWHNRYLYNTTLHVPLIMVLEGKAVSGRRVRTNVSHVDIHPTLLELLDVSGPRSPDGVSLVPALEGGAVAERDIYSETLVWALEMARGVSVRSLIRGDHKWIRTDSVAPAKPGRINELYDMTRDAREVDDLVSSAAASGFEDLEVRLGELSDRLEAAAVTPERMALDDTTKAKLRALGYLGD